MGCALWRRKRAVVFRGGCRVLHRRSGSHPGASASPHCTKEEKPTMMSTLLQVVCISWLKLSCNLQPFFAHLLFQDARTGGSLLQLTRHGESVCISVRWGKRLQSSLVSSSMSCRFFRVSVSNMVVVSCYCCCLLDVYRFVGDCGQ
jgi:hypothetical protein